MAVEYQKLAAVSIPSELTAWQKRSGCVFKIYGLRNSCADPVIVPIHHHLVAFRSLRSIVYRVILAIPRNPKSRSWKEVIASTGFVLISHVPEVRTKRVRPRTPFRPPPQAKQLNRLFKKLYMELTVETSHKRTDCWQCIDYAKLLQERNYSAQDWDDMSSKITKEASDSGRQALNPCG